MKKIIISGILLILAVVAISGCTSSDNSTSGQSEINVTNVSVSSSGSGFYNINAVIVPSKNIDYLEMAAIWYDSSGAVIESSPLVWNVNNVQAGQVYKANGEDSLYQKGTPTKVDIYIFDSVFSGGDTSKAIYHQTVNLKS
jgi:hypothetical protein